MAKKSRNRRETAKARTAPVRFADTKPRTQGNALGAPQRQPNRLGTLSKKVGLIDQIFDPARQAKPDTRWRDTKARLTPIPEQHSRAVSGSTTTKLTATPQKKGVKTKLTEPVKQSPEARDKKRTTVCKARPEGRAPRRPGGGASKEFIPWCDRKK